MKPFVRIALTSGHVYQIPADVIAQNRAQTMLELHPSEFADLAASLEDTREVFEDSAEIRDWALNNMNPDDYMPHARLVRFVPPAQDHSTAEWLYDDAPAILGELDGDSIMQQPVEAVLTTMAASNQLVNLTVLNNDEGKPFGALALIIGNEPIIGAFASTMQFTANQLLESGAATITPTH